ncbi:hypothetical protein, partial [Akkermansia sp.]|uniref:hypothetical protein n=1 Tax=Akkermansia sp. TaxID=1872421 RepID=UPI003A858EF2
MPGFDFLEPFRRFFSGGIGKQFLGLAKAGTHDKEDERGKRRTFMQGIEVYHNGAEGLQGILTNTAYEKKFHLSFKKIAGHIVLPRRMFIPVF